MANCRNTFWEQVLEVCAGRSLLGQSLVVASSVKSAVPTLDAGDIVKAVDKLSHGLLSSNSLAGVPQWQCRLAKK